MDFLDEDLSPSAPPPAPAPKREKPRARESRRAAPAVHGREMPHSVEAERALLACCLMDGATVLERCHEAGVDAGAFHHPANRLLFEAMVAVSGYGGDTVLDPITVFEELRRRGVAEEVGGWVGISTLTDGLTTTAQMRQYLGIVQGKARMREVIRQATALVEAGFSGDVEATAVLLNRMGKVELGPTVKRLLPPIEDVTMMTFDELPAMPAEVVKGLLHRTTKAVIGGSSKGKKTWALIDLAVSVACGREWWGFGTVPGKVVYVNFEIPRAFFARRVQAVEEVKGCRVKPGMLSVWTLRGHAKPIAELVGDMLAELERMEGLALLVVDPIYKFFEGLDENKAGDASFVLNRLEQICVKVGCALAFGAHYSKGNQAAKEAIDRIGGSGVFARDPDTILTMTAHQEEGAFTVDATLRNLAPIEHFVIRWDYPLFTRDASLDPEDLKRAKPVVKKVEKDKGKGGRPARWRIEDLLRHYPESGAAHLPASDVFREARVEGFTPAPKHLYYFQKQMLGFGWIEPASKMDKRYRRTELGDSVVRNDKGDEP